MATRNPIRRFSRIGNWDRNHGFKETDRRLLTRPTTVQKFLDRWRRSKHIFDIYLVNTPRSNKADFREIGKIEGDKLNDDLGTAIEFQPDAISVVFTNNVGAEKVPFTGWIAAHRFGHALWRMQSPRAWKRIQYVFNQILDAYNLPIHYPYRISKYDSERGEYSRMAYGGWMTTSTQRYHKYLAQHIGTMQSARTNRLRTPYEFYYELLAQYMLTGRVRFRPLTNCVIFGPAPWGRKFTSCLNDPIYLTELNERLRSLAYELEDLFDRDLDEATGKVFLM